MAALDQTACGMAKSVVHACGSDASPLPSPSGPQSVFPSSAYVTKHAPSARSGSVFDYQGDLFSSRVPRRVLRPPFAIQIVQADGNVG